MVLGFRRNAEFETRANVKRCVQLAIATHTPILLVQSRNCITPGFLTIFNYRPSGEGLRIGLFFSTADAFFNAVLPLVSGLERLQRRVRHPRVAAAPSPLGS